MANNHLGALDERRRDNAHRGMKLLQMWVPDTHSRKFVKEAERQLAQLRNDPQEKEVLQFIGEVADFSGWQP
ncbi:antitoxin MazE family protein [Candidatus Magnetomonas plexicatena]|uniref:antitoxin MazE family protein n=1 Tax=Candidatus Magnetomonas plexicatena TaxID=2552947 RepID=UPI001C78436F|nr:antitoxin MazE family protein [Nitrospirales bacterium LBB_01]